MPMLQLSLFGGRRIILGSVRHTELDQLIIQLSFEHLLAENIIHKVHDSFV